MTALALIVAAIWVYLLGFHGRFWQAGPVLPPARPERAPPVVAVVPARNEALGIADSLASLLAQDYGGPFRAVLVDDASTDSTGEIARRIGDPRLTVLTGRSRPAGWSGKIWALAQGLGAAEDSELLLLTDADIIHDPRHLAALVAAADRGGYDLVSEMVALTAEGEAGRTLLPAFVYFFQLLYPFDWVNDPLRATAAAAGGTILIRRRALERIGGIEAVRDALIDDVALAAAVKRGGPIWLGHSMLARSARAYPGWADVWRMITRSAYIQLRRSPLLLICSMGAMALTFLAPPLIALFGHGPARLLGLAAWAGLALSYVPSLRRSRLSGLRAPLLVLTALFYIAATVASALDHHRGRGAIWKGRAYTGATR
ncbi:MAG: glycosyltransferase [Alphaproteobacteria bacterium]|nr:glycosyltransferase [Alphaproteobacteria bacterium]